MTPPKDIPSNAFWQGIPEEMFEDPIKPDMINPDHYKVGGIETIDYLRAKLTQEEFAGYCRGNALKYLSRAGHKDEAAQDIGKAIWYLEQWLDSRSHTHKPI